MFAVLTYLVSFKISKTKDLFWPRRIAAQKKMSMGRNTGGMRLNPSLPALMMGMYMHGIQLRLFNLRFLALMCLWMPPQLSRLPHSIAGQVVLAIFESGHVSWVDMGGHGSFPRCCVQEGWRYVDIFCFSEIPHASNCPSCFHPCNGVSNFWPAMCTPGHMPQYKENAAFAQPSPINLYIYTSIYI